MLPPTDFLRGLPQMPSQNRGLSHSITWMQQTIIWALLFIIIYLFIKFNL